MTKSKSTHDIFVTLGASSHTKEDREQDDFYATDPKASELLLELETFSDTIIDNSYGSGHLMKAFQDKGKKIIGYDIVDRRQTTNDNVEFHLQDWLHVKHITKGADIVFNPPYKLSTEFVEHTLNIVEENTKVCAFLKLQFLEGKKRKQLFEKYPPKRIWVSSSRIQCFKNGDMNIKEKSSAICYAWFVWEKGYKGYPELKWFN